MTTRLRTAFGWIQSANLKSKSGPPDQNVKLVSLSLVALMLAVAAPVVEAQQPPKIPRIGYLDVVSLSVNAARVEAFRQGLRALGYVEGKNIIIEWRSTDGKAERVPALLAEFIQLKVDIIVSVGSATTRPAKKATSTIPIIMTQDNDPVASGIVSSLARPGGNITGLSNFAPELSGKRLEILKEVVPKLSRVAVLGTSNIPGHAQMSQELDLAAKAFEIKLHYYDIGSSKDIALAFQAAKKVRAQAVLTLGTPILVSRRAQVIDLAVKNQIPAIYHSILFVNSGGLMFYGVDILDLDRRAATFVDKILKGRSPAELPVEQPVKFDFVVNLPAAKKIDLTIPPNVLVRANRVIQ